MIVAIDSFIGILITVLVKRDEANMEVSFIKFNQIKSDSVVFLVDEELKIGTQLKALDGKKAISKALSLSPNFKGKSGQVLSILNADLKFPRILLLGLGNKKAITTNSLQSAGGKLASYLNASEISNITLCVEGNYGSKLSASDIACNIAFGAKLKNYMFNKYFVNRKNEYKIFLNKLSVALEASSEAQKSFRDLNVIAEGVYFARDLVSQPPNILYPESYAEECIKLEKKSKLKVSVLTVKDMQKLGMGALLGVGQGSIRESRLVVLEWSGHPKGKKEAPVAFVGKGVTFDSGGISIKPSTGMADMKYDMAGSAAVVGVMKVLAERKAKVNAIGVIGLVENMPDGNAQKPADVVTSMSGQTIEIDNTDAEGRLVLADALWYTQDKYKPKFMVNLATLTGAMVVALGEGGYAGLFSNDDKLAQQITEVGEEVNEKNWRFPLHEFFDKQINSEIADVRNTGTGRGAGSITAAQFLQRFVNKCKWAHLDIAGMAWDKNGNDVTPKGATGYGVRLLNQLVMKYYEAK